LPMGRNPANLQPCWIGLHAPPSSAILTG
jgi:hypothetical protein